MEDLSWGFANFANNNYGVPCIPGDFDWSLYAQTYIAAPSSPSAVQPGDALVFGAAYQTLGRSGNSFGMCLMSLLLKTTGGYLGFGGAPGQYLGDLGTDSCEFLDENGNLASSGMGPTDATLRHAINVLQGYQLNPAVVQYYFENLRFVVAYSRPPAPPQRASRYYGSTVSRTSQPYNLTVASGSSGAQYDVSADAWLEGKKEQYLFAPVTSLLVDGSRGAEVDLTECAAILDIRFLNSTSGPVAIGGGHIEVHPASSPSTLSAVASTMDAGTTNNFLVVRGDETNIMDVYFQVGSDPSFNQITYHQQITISAPCDQIVTVPCAVPDQASLGRIVGNIQMLGEFEVTTEDYSPLYPGYTHMTANSGPNLNFRFNKLPGANFTQPSHGMFTLANLLPSDAVSPSQGYTVYGEMAFRTNYQFEWFRTPFLGYRGNGSFYVPNGSTVDVGNTFVINPGYIDGRIYLKGPDESAGPSVLRNILQPPDYDFNHDGIPDQATTRIYGNGNYWSWINVTGVERLATGATKNAGGGLAAVGFDGAYNAPDNAFEGGYEAVVGGLLNESSIWTPDTLELRIGPGDLCCNPAPNILFLHDHLAPQIEVAPEQHYNHDLRYCFSEVTVGFRSDSGTFFSPRIQSSVGSFTGADFENNPADYGVEVTFTSGTPSDQAHATNQGAVVLSVPQGTYNLYPFVNLVSSDGGYTFTQLQPINGLNVGCAQHIFVQPGGPQLSLALPSSSTQASLVVTGSVTAASNIAMVVYSLNGGLPTIVCTNCDMNPVFSFNLNLGNGQLAPGHRL